MYNLHPLPLPDQVNVARYGVDVHAPVKTLKFETLPGWGGGPQAVAA